MRSFYRAKRSKKQKMRLPLSAYLSYLLIATLLFTGVSFSKFASSGSSDDNARVAVVVVDGGSYDEANLSLGSDEMSATYEFYLTNSDDYGQTSEVSLDYTVVVTIPDGEKLPDGVDMSLTYSYEVYDDDGNWLETATSDCSLVSSENGVYTFDGGADFAAGEWGYHDYILTFTMNEEFVTEDSSFTDITISVKAEQID